MDLKPRWYIGTETLVTILQVIKNLNEDLKRKIIKIIVWHNKSEEERYNIVYYDNDIYDAIDYDTLDWY